MTLKRANFTERPHVPQLNRAIRASGGQRLVVGGKGYRIDSSLVGVKRGDLSRGGYVPQFDRVVFAAGGQFRAAVEKDYDFNPPCVAANPTT
jgi:hypothetical protein